MTQHRPTRNRRRTTTIRKSMGAVHMKCKQMDAWGTEQTKHTVAAETSCGAMGRQCVATDLVKTGHVIGDQIDEFASRRVLARQLRATQS